MHFVVVIFILIFFNLNIGITAEGETALGEIGTERTSQIDVNAARALLEKIEKSVLLDKSQAKLSLASFEKTLSDESLAALGSQIENAYGHIALLNGNFPEASRRLLNARSIAEKTGNIEQEAESYRREGIMYFLLDSPLYALEQINKSLSLHKQSGSIKILDSVASIVEIYEYLEQYDDMKRYALLLLEEATEKNDFGDIAAAHNNLALAFIKEENFAQARIHLRHESAASELSTDESNFSLYFAKAKLAIAEGNYETALDHIQIHNQKIKDSDFVVGLPGAMILESDARRANGEIDTAITIAQEALTLIEELNLSVYKVKALDKLSTLYEITGDFEKALSTQNQLIKVMREQRQFNSLQLLAVNRSKLDLAATTHQMEKLQQRNKVIELKQKNQLMLIIVSVLAILLLSFLAFYLRKKVEVTQKADKAKSEFLARISHEIRTPISAIMGLTNLSLERVRDKGISTNLQQINSTSYHLLTLVNDLLDFSKIEAGKMTLESTSFEVEDVVKKAIDMISIEANNKKVVTNISIMQDVPKMVKGDPHRLQQVLNNLLSNAIKFTDKGSISVTVSNQPSQSNNELNPKLKFEVRDSGCGISELEQSRLFSAFTQADESITRRYGGTGLGLTIAKELVELMGGEIWLESAMRLGTIFYFTISYEKLNEVLPEKNKKTETHGKKQYSDLNNIHILLAEDHELVRKVIIGYLDTINPQITVVNNGKEAIDILEHDESINIFITDHQMPIMDGITATKFIRKNLKLDIPIIALTAHATTGEIEDSKAAGVDAYLTKPADPILLLETIESLLIKK